MTLILATDGSANPNPGPGGWAWVSNDGRYECGSFASGTNNIGELTAMKMALRAFPDVPLIIEYDSQYAHDCITLWGPSWRHKNITGKKNQDLIYTCMNLVARRKASLTWKKVKAHSAPGTFPLNEKADALANAMSAQHKKSHHRGFLSDADCPVTFPDVRSNKSENGHVNTRLDQVKQLISHLNEFDRQTLRNLLGPDK